MSDGMLPIRPGTVLRALREDIVLSTDDGLLLVGELALPADRPVAATLVCLHPLPTAGGFMDSHVLRKAAARLPALADIAVLRFNTRGTESPRGRSGGVFDEGRAERLDVEAAVRFALERGLTNRWLLGWSFGTELALQYGLATDTVGAILLSPPLHRASADAVAAWHDSGRRLLALVPEFDDYLRPAEAAERFRSVPEAEIVGVDGAKHLWVGEPAVRRVLDEIVQRVRPSAAPLPTEVPAALVVQG